MDNKAPLEINYPVLFVILFQIVFIIFGIITIKNFLNEKTSVPRINISNYSDISDTKVLGQDNGEVNKSFFSNDEKKSVIESAVYDIVLSNTNGNNIEKNSAKIRTDSIHNVYIADLHYYLLNFIVDLEDIGQSYRVVYRKTSDYPAIAFCLHEEELIYGKFDCKDKYDNYGADIVVHGLMQGHAFSNFSTILSDTYKGDPLKITIKLPPGEEPPEEVAIQELSHYLSELGFNLDDFQHEIVRPKPFTISR